MDAKFLNERKNQWLNRFNRLTVIRIWQILLLSIMVDSIIAEELIKPIPAPTFLDVLFVTCKSLIYVSELIMESPPPLSTLVNKLSKATGSAAKLIKSSKETPLPYPFVIVNPISAPCELFSIVTVEDESVPLITN